MPDKLGRRDIKAVHTLDSNLHIGQSASDKLPLKGSGGELPTRQLPLSSSAESASDKPALPKY